MFRTIVNHLLDGGLCRNICNGGLFAVRCDCLQPRKHRTIYRREWTLLIHAAKSTDEMQHRALTGRYFWSVGPLPAVLNGGKSAGWIRGLNSARKTFVGRAAPGPSAWSHVPLMFTDYFRGPGGACCPVCMCVWLFGQWLLNQLTFDVDIWHAGSSWHCLC